jgi:hypothetical protein
MEPLRSSPAAVGARNAAPHDAVVLNMAAASDVKPPFVLREDAAASDGVALALPAGTGSRGMKGRATLKFDTPLAGSYLAWARARWRDACGNSVAIKIDDSAERVVGQDAVYGSWHWVPAGRYELAAGAHSILLA